MTKPPAVSTAAAGTLLCLLIELKDQAVTASRCLRG